MNKIIFNYYGMQACCNSKFHGAGEYGKTVLKYLVENYSNIVNIAIIYNPICEIDSWLNKILIEREIKKIEIDNMCDISTIIKKYKADIFYSPTRLSKDIRKQIGDNVLIKETLHDFRAIELIDDIKMSRYMSLDGRIKNALKWIIKRYYKKYLISETQKEIDIINNIYCVSKHTYYSMHLMFKNLSTKKIKVFYSPSKYIPKQENLSNPLPKDKYILILGGDRWTKNPFRTVLALDSVLTITQCEKYKVVIIGNISKALKRKIRNKDKFVFNGYLGTNMLERYYANCDIFVYASLNEGFGYPPIEAMKYGKTCVVSGTTSIPEVCGNAVYYVNPYNMNEIAEKVMMALNEKIDELIVKERASYINEIQLSSLRDLCEDIVSI